MVIEKNEAKVDPTHQMERDHQDGSAENPSPENHPKEVNYVIDKKKGGPKKPYAIDNLMKILTSEKITEIKQDYYINRMAKHKLGKKYGISHQLVTPLMERLGPLRSAEII